MPIYIQYTTLINTYVSFHNTAFRVSTQIDLERGLQIYISQRGETFYFILKC